MGQGAPGSKVFVSFRNGDDPFAAALIYRALAARFGADALFRSSESIVPGQRWAETIWAGHRSSLVVVAVIGPRWLGITDGRGERRLLQEGDWVRAEIAEALAAGKTVVPVLVEGAARPASRDLPPDLKDLTALQSVPLSHRRIDYTIDALVDVIEPLIDAGTESARGLGEPGRRPTGAGWLEVWKVPSAGLFAVERPELLGGLRAALHGTQAAETSPGVVLLHGGVGVGKSCLAAEYARRYAGDYQSVWWIEARQPRLIPEQLAELAGAAGFDDGRDVSAGLAALFRQLRARGRWLLVLDGLEDPAALAPLLPAFGPGGDVLITSRTEHWGLAAVRRVAVGPFGRDQSCELLAEHLDGVTPDAVDRLAAALDDLPLAVAQAAAFLADAPFGVDTYLNLLGTRAGELLVRGETHVYPGTLGAAWSLALDRLAEAAPGAQDLVSLLGVLGPAAVPFALFAEEGASAGLPAALAQVVADPMAWSDLVAAVADCGLVVVRDGVFHPRALFQSFVRDRIGPEQVGRIRETARQALAAAAPDDPRDPGTWSRFSLLWPHVFAVDPAASPDSACRRLILAAAQYLVVRGDAATALELVSAALDRWSAQADRDEHLVTQAAAHLAQAHFRLGDYGSAAAVDEDVLARRERLYGPDDPETLAAAHNLAMDRWARDGGGQAAALADVLERRRLVLGADHPDTRRSAHNLALALRASGELERALELDEANLRGLTSVLGPGHPDTLRSAYATALDLRGLGRWEQALELDQDTYARLSDRLGTDHRDTLRAAYAVAVGLRRGGDPARAYVLARETYERRRRVLGAEHVDTLRCMLLVGELEAETRRGVGEEVNRSRVRDEAAQRLAAWAGRAASDRTVTRG
ncbi:MAG TPA: FxSxx-COOH system tetratricopeptide repeat protein [Actinocrinis sp.]|nr:FxSxx-COOH system tetratricopeptide repeat protein [Actinocrinis sp.]